jgi:hypothetical protein
MPLADSRHRVNNPIVDWIFNCKMPISETNACLKFIIAASIWVSYQNVELWRSSPSIVQNYFNPLGLCLWQFSLFLCARGTMNAPVICVLLVITIFQGAGTSNDYFICEFSFGICSAGWRCSRWRLWSGSCCADTSQCARDGTRLIICNSEFVALCFRMQSQLRVLSSSPYSQGHWGRFSRRIVSSGSRMVPYGHILLFFEVCGLERVRCRRWNISCWASVVGVGKYAEAGVAGSTRGPWEEFEACEYFTFFSLLIRHLSELCMVHYCSSRRCIHLLIVILL